MSIEAKARIVVEGGSQALKQLAGVQRATTRAGSESVKAGKQQERSAREAAKAYEKQAREAERAARSTANAQEREAKRAAAAILKQEARKLREIEQSAKKATKVAEREAAKQVRLAEKTAASEVKARKAAFRSAGGLIAGATGAVVSGGLASAAVARGIAGQSSAADRVKQGNIFKTSLIQTAAQAKLTPAQRDVIEQRSLATASRTGTDPLEIAGGLEIAQKSFNSFEAFSGMMDEIATVSKASGASIESLVGAMGFARQAFDLTEEQTLEALHKMVAGASEGAIEMPDFSSVFAPVFGLFAEMTKLKGMQGVEQFIGTAQAIGSLGSGAAESAVMMTNFVSAINEKETSRKLKRLGVDTTSDTPEVIISKLAASPKFQTEQQRQAVFTEKRARNAATALVSARMRVQAGEEGAVDIGSIAAVKASAGRELTRSTFEQMQTSGVLETDREVVKMQAETIENLEDYNDQILLVLKASNELETSFGTLSIWASSIAAMGVGGVLSGMLGGAGAAGGAAGVLSTVKALGTMGMWAGGVAAAGTAGYMGAKALGADTAGEWIGNKLYELFSNPPGSEGARKVNLPATPGEQAASAEKSSKEVQTLQRSQVDETKAVRKSIEGLREDIRNGGRPIPTTNTQARGAR